MNDDVIQVLLIEDDQAVRRSVARLLLTCEEPRFEVNYAESLRAGLDIMTNSRVDVILLDLGLPDSQGAQTFLAVSETISHIPVVVLTGLNDKEVCEKILSSGARDLLIKSELNEEMLVESLTRAVRRNQRELKRLGLPHSRETDLEEFLVWNPNGLVVMDQKGVTLFVNPAAERLMGKKTQELIGKKSGIPITNGENKGVFSVEQVGGMVFVEATVYQILWQGKLAYLASLQSLVNRAA